MKVYVLFHVTEVESYDYNGVYDSYDSINGIFESLDNAIEKAKSEGFEKDLDHVCNNRDNVIWVSNYKTYEYDREYMFVEEYELQ